MASALTVAPMFISTRVRAAISLLCLCTLVEMQAWRWGAEHRVLRIGGIVLLAIVAIDCFLTYRSCVFARSPSARGAWLEIVGVTVALGLLIALGGWWLREDYEHCWRFLERKNPADLSRWILVKAGVVALQQLALHWIVTPLCRDAVGSRTWGGVLAGVLFGLLHLPSLVLTAVTMFGGWAWIALFGRGGRVVPLMISHLALALLVHGLVPERYTLCLRIGAGAAEIEAHLYKTRTAEHRRHMHLLMSDKYTQRWGEGDDFIRGAFFDLLDRNLQMHTLDDWHESKHTRSEIAETILTSAHYEEKLSQRGVPRVLIDPRWWELPKK